MVPMKTGGRKSGSRNFFQMSEKPKNGRLELCNWHNDQEGTLCPVQHTTVAAEFTTEMHCKKNSKLTPSQLVKCYHVILTGETSNKNKIQISKNCRILW